MAVCNPCGKIYERLLGRCPPLSFPPPWSFLQPADDCRGPVYDPAQTLAALRGEFPDVKLWRAGVLDLAPDGQYRLSPELTNPVGAVIALRDHPKRSPFFLLTARGCLPKVNFPIKGALQDGWTAGKVVRGGVLFAAPRIGDVALLRALGFPATLATGIPRLRPNALRDLDARFGGQDFVPAAPRGNAPPTAGEAGEVAVGGSSRERPAPARPTLALLGWSPLAPAAQPSPALSAAVARLTAARRHLGLPFAGVMAWRLAPQDLENLQFRLPFRDARLVRELLRESADSLADFECLAHGNGPPAEAAPGAGYVAAQADLLATLAGDRAAGRLSHRVRRAVSVYEAMVQRDLVAPLQEWALESDDPVIRNAGVELATACGLLHRMSPLLFDLQGGQLERARGADIEPVPAKVFAQYLALTARFGGLLRDLCQWRKA